MLICKAMDFRFFTCFTFVLMCTTSFAYPLGLDNAIIGGSQVLMNFGDGFQQWGESNKQQVVPHYGSYGRERALLEMEGKISQLDSAYTRSHQFIAEIVGHKPLIDITQEHEKYGNDGAKSRRVATALIGGFDGVANIVNSVLDAPYDKARYASKQATSALNAIGATFAGL
ncbi:uncharacterized protein [Atheta coriaria]|uniref:uncharacterized protein isoform X2 n=1 Tax=Dalotia coriaria TaxID=877792 RepID=UPI0031F37E52